MDKVVTSLLVIHENGVIEEQAGGYSDWEARGGKLKAEEVKRSDSPQIQNDPSLNSNGEPTGTEAKVTAEAKPPKKKLSYKEQRELEALPAQIEDLETKLTQIESLISAPTFYSSAQASIDETLKTLSDTQHALDHALERWAELED